MADPTGVIHDLGYQRYAGERLGRGYAFRTLYFHSLRAAFGLGRGTKAKLLPFAMLALSCLPAVISVGTQALSGQKLIAYQDYPRALQLPLIVFLAGQAPELVSRDLGNRVLPLYFCRPIERDDYALAKLAAMVTAVFAVLLAPLLIAFLGSAFAGSGLDHLWTETKEFLPGLVNAALHALVLAPLALLVAATTGRRAFATGGVVAVFLATAPVAGVLFAAGGDVARLAGLLNPFELLNGVREWLFGGGAADIGRFGPLYGFVALCLFVATTGGLLLRYRKVAT
ncbi:ABC transporter permease [Carbonactinospora thermoautotrophica]|uniref:Integral membrane protein n=1 Tax=Carbonactinospora thermoautotrophica TaxID=1469144 RepID=A0A132N0N4_9ACTN|nr:hypothetical protein [Carbonactinospora thermoautotrophica]KWX02672.1 Integral membrane protein [Carbonactinospora thermoautotrophica]KWX03725.1 hypothetical protein TH66_13080 [Carbonactinospora thermoautotrophica]KWX09431.1 hypothetical protein TR74_09620 [Carbonactinospora thermoautotrophica]MCX9190500.1 ABC transporter permease [Carbonactinospora thermoautotrophica]